VEETSAVDMAKGSSAVKRSRSRGDGGICGESERASDGGVRAALLVLGTVRE
jgi:hypothetical protein